MCKFWLGSPYLTKLGALTQLQYGYKYMFSVSTMGYRIYANRTVDPNLRVEIQLLEFH